MRGLGAGLNDLKARISKAQEELGTIEGHVEPLPEVIDATNLLRVNEYLAKSDAKKSEMLAAYAEYTRHLEQLVSSLLEIQEDLKEIVRTEAALIASKPATKEGKTQKKQRHASK